MKSLRIGRPVGAVTILNTLATRNYTICNVRTVASFGHSAPRRHVVLEETQLARGHVGRHTMSVNVVLAVAI